MHHGCFCRKVDFDSRPRHAEPGILTRAERTAKVPSSIPFYLESDCAPSNLAGGTYTWTPDLQYTVVEPRRRLILLSNLWRWKAMINVATTDRGYTWLPSHTVVVRWCVVQVAEVQGHARVQQVLNKRLV